MAQSGFTPISLYYSSTGAAVPSAGNLVAGELALNTNDGKLYYKNSSGVVTLLAGATSGPAGGSTTQVQYNNAGVLAGITGATTNGTALTLVAPVLGTPASGTVTNLTGTASININGTVGATTPATAAFTSVTSTVTAANNLILNRTDNGPALVIQTNGVNKGTIGGSGANLVFSGPNGASGAGEIQLTTTGLAVTGTLSATGTLSGGTSGTGYSFSGSAAAGSLTLDSSGNLGLGVTAPLNRLDARAASAVIANYQTIQASSTDSAAIDLGGGIGLGGYYNGTAAYATFGNIVGRKENSTSGNYAGYLAFGTNAQATGVVERARINSIGDLLVNQTAAGLQNSNSFGCGPSDVGFVANHVSGTAGGTTFGNFGLAGAGIGSITQNGTTGVLYNLTSDYRLKNDQQPLTGAKDFIMALKPKKWQWWDGSGEGVGFVAHEFMEVAKYSGHGEKDAVDAEGKPIMQSIQPSSSEVMANLISFIQEQQAIITALTTRITALEAK